MNLSWLVVMVFLNGSPVPLSGFPPKLVPRGECVALGRALGTELAAAFPLLSGEVRCFDLDVIVLPKGKAA